MRIQFFVSGIPKAQPRARATIRPGAKHASVYDPGTANDWRRLVMAAAQAAYRGEPLTVPLRIDVAWYFPRPKSHFRTGRRAGELREDAPVCHSGRPDRDNLDKTILDALEACGLLHDDCLACLGTLAKYYVSACNHGGQPGASVTIRNALGWEGERP